MTVEVPSNSMILSNSANISYHAIWIRKLNLTKVLARISPDACLTFQKMDEAIVRQGLPLTAFI